MWNVGGTIVFPEKADRFDPNDIWDTVEREGVNAMTIVGDAFARPLLAALGTRSRDLSSLRQISSGGAMLSADVKRALLEGLPGVRILDVLGSSESGTQAVRASTPLMSPWRSTRINWDSMTCGALSAWWTSARSMAG